MITKSFRRMLQTMKSSRVRSAAIFASLVLVLLFGVVQASGPMRKPMPPHPSHGGMWGMKMPRWMPWIPAEPVPKIKIVAVFEDLIVFFETEDFPENQEFMVTMGEMYTRGINGIEIDTFNSGDGSSQLLGAFIPADLYGRDRISIRASTDHQYPYYAYNWFWNNTAIAPEYSALEGMTAEDVQGALESISSEGLIQLDSLEAPISDAEVVEAPAAEDAAATEEAPAAEEAPVAEEAPAAEEAESTEGVGGAEEAEEAAAGTELAGVVWQWTGFSDPVQGDLNIDTPEQYTVEFTAEGLVGVKADCNNGSGTYIADEEGGIDIAIGIVTAAACAPESLSDLFLQDLGEAADYSVDETGLTLGLPDDGGTLSFAAADAAEAPADEAAETTEEAAEETTEEAAEETTEEAAEETTEEAAEETTEEAAEAASVTGTVTYMQRIALPDDAVVKVQIYNASLADATEVLGEQIIETGGQQVPIPYEVAYNPDEINENLMYSVSARIEDAEENLLFISDTVTLVITNGNPTEDVEIMAIQVQSSPEAEAPTEETAEATEGEEAAPAEGEEAPSLTGVVWTWTEFSDPVQGTLPVENPEMYTAEFLEDGTVGVKLDCNNGSGSYVADEEGGIDITIGAVTLALCEEDSLGDQFQQYLDAAVIYFFDEGDLLLDLPADSGTLRFAAAPAEEAGATAKLASITTVPVFQDNGEEEVSTVPSFTICAVVKGETVSVEGENFPADQTFTVKMGVPQVVKPMYPKPMPPMGKPAHPMPPMGKPAHPMPPMEKPAHPMPMGPMKPGAGMWMKPEPKIWIPYYEAGTLETVEGGAIEATFDIPAELAGAYKISVLMITDHQFPYLSYNWFYNNDAEGYCNGEDGENG